MPHELPHALARRLALALASVLVLTFAAAEPAAAQKRAEEEVPPIVDEIRVDVVNVDVVVTDKDGNPVPGLTPEDFVLYEDGDRREITNFYSFVDGRSTGAAQEEADGGSFQWADSATVRRMVILFDNQSLEKRDRSRALEAIERFILEQFDGTYEWAVVAYGSEVQLVEPFTSNKTRVLAALSKVDRLPVPIRRAQASDRTFTEDRPLVARGQAFGNRSGLDQGPGPLGVTVREFELRDRMMNGLRTLSNTTEALVQTMRAYSAVPGRKSLLLITGTMDMIPGADQLFGRGLPGAGSENRTDPVAASVHTEVLRRFELIVKIANAAGFAIYPLSNSPLIDAHASQLEVERSLSMSFNGAASSSAASIDLESAPAIMAAGTGGRYFTSSKFYDAVSEVDYQTANSYVLGFQTTREPDGEYHKLRVETRFSGLQVRHREGYIHLSREARLLEELATPLVFPKNQGDFAVAVEVLPPEQSSKKDVTLTVAGLVPISDITLIPQGDAMVGRVDLLLAIYDREGNLVNLLRHRQDVSIPIAKIEEAAEDAPARFGIKVRDLARGDYTFSLTLLDALGDRHGTGLQTMAL